MEQSESSEGKVMKQFKICAMTDAATARQNEEDIFLLCSDGLMGWVLRIAGLFLHAHYKTQNI